MLSRTGQAVALMRADMIRPHTPAGDPDAQRRLCAGMAPTDVRRPGIAARTRFFDEQVLAALGRDIRQVVICGAGYDDRALRFRTPDVRFFELDHPATQADKRDRLERSAPTGPTWSWCRPTSASTTPPPRSPGMVTTHRNHRYDANHGRTSVDLGVRSLILGI